MRDDAEEAEAEADEDAEVEADDSEQRAGGDAIDGADDELPAEKCDEVAVHFDEAGDDLVLEFARAQRDVFRPRGRDVRRLGEEVER